jgi:hypothetical protein
LAITQCSIAGRNVLMATPGKAICDILYFSVTCFKHKKDLIQHLHENLRLEPKELKKLDLTLMQMLTSIYQHSSIDLFFDYIKGIHEHPY